MAFIDNFLIASPSGASVSVRRSDVPEPCAVVQVNHGLAEHSARYRRFAETLAGHGIATYAHDHRGHGHTTAPQAPRGSFGPLPAADLVLDDVLAVHEQIASDHPGVPVIVFGHSMGGLIALNFVLRHHKRVAGAAIWNAPRSAGVLGQAARLALAWERMRLGSDVPSRILPALSFRPWGKRFSETGTGFDWLSRDTDEVRKYADDPLCGWDASVGMWRTVFEFGLRADKDASFADIDRELPLHLVGGAHDPATNDGKDMTRLAQRLRRMGFSNLKSTIYPDTRHESLNETNRDEITADLIDWIEGQVLADR